MSTLQQPHPHPGGPKKSSVTVIYNGVSTEVDAQPQAAVQALLNHALHAFGLQGQPNFALFTDANVQLDPNRSLRDQGVPDGATLILRPLQVRAGSSAGRPTSGRPR